MLAEQRCNPANPNHPITRLLAPQAFPTEQDAWRQCDHVGVGVRRVGYIAGDQTRRARGPACAECAASHPLKHVAIEDVPAELWTWVWRCEGCDTTTYVSFAGGNLNKCDCDDALMTCGRTVAGHYEHMGYAEDIIGDPPSRAANAERREILLRTT